jgi:RNA polymerase sigma factor (sigma-70 family)
MYGDDAALLNAWITARDAEAFKSLTQRYSAMVYSTCLRVLGNSKDAEELTQESFLKLAEIRNAPTQSLGGWLHAVARNTSISRIRSDVRREKREKTYVESQPSDSEATWNDIVPFVDEAIASLPTELRDPIIAHFLEDLSHREIAETVGVKREAVTYRIKKGVEGIRSHLKRKGVAVSSVGLAVLAQTNFAQAAPHQVSVVLGKLALGGNTMHTNSATVAAGKELFGVSAKFVLAATVAVVAAVGSIVYVAMDPPISQLPVSEAEQVNASEPILVAQVEAEIPEILNQQDPVLVPTFSGRTSDSNSVGGGEIFGTVVDETGAIVAGAEVIIDGTLDEFWLHPDKSSSRQSTVTNEKGEFKFLQLPGPYDERNGFTLMAFQDDKSAFERTSFAWTGFADPVTLSLVASKRLAGLVIDKEGNPIPDARVYPVRHGTEERDQSIRALVLRAISNEIGQFTLRGLNPGDWDLVTTAEGFAARRTDLVTAGNYQMKIILDEGEKATGRVVDAKSNDPAPGVQLLVSAMAPSGRFNLSPWNMRIVESDENGNYELVNLPERQFRTQLARRHEDTYVKLDDGMEEIYFDVNQGKAVDVPPFYVMRGGEVSGRVYDPETGDGLGGVLIRILLNGTISSAPGWTKIHTNSRGEYRFAGLKHGVHKIYLEHQFQHMKALELEPQEVVENLDFAHTMAAWVAGRTVDAHGNPVPFARVRTDSKQVSNDVRIMSDENGRFDIRGLNPTSDLMVTASTTSNRAAPWGPFPVTKEGIKGIVLVLDQPRTASVTGIVVDENGQGLKGANVHIDHAQSDYHFSARVKTDEVGFFSAEGLIEGKYTIDVFPPSQNTWVQGKGKTEIVLANGQSVQGLRLVYPPDGMTISGRVTNEWGDPVRDAWVQASGGSREDIRTNADGIFSLKGLAEGPHLISVNHQKYTDIRGEIVEAGTANIDFVMKRRSYVSGRVVRADTGEPIEGFELLALRGEYQFLNTGTLRNFSRRSTKIQNSNGEFFLNDVQAGPATVVATAKGVSPGFATVKNVGSAETANDIEIRLQPEYTVEGIVHDRSGEPLGGAKVYLGNVRDRSFVDHETPLALSKPDGSFRADSLPDFVRVLTFIHPEYAVAVVPLRLRSDQRYDPVRPVLTRGGNISGKFTINGEVPTKGVQSIKVEYPSEADATGVYATVGSTGNFVIRSIHGGEITLKATYQEEFDRGQQYGQARHVIVKDNQTLEVNFDISTDGGVVEGRITELGEYRMGDRVRVSIENDEGVFPYESQLGTDGEYRVEDLPSGSVTIQYPTFGRAQKRFQHELSSGGTIRQDIEILGTDSVAYRVSQSVANMSTNILLIPGDVDVSTMNFSVYQLLESQAVSLSSRITHDWRLRFIKLDPGTYTLVAVTADTWTREGIDHAAYASETVTLDGEEEFVAFEF